LVAVIISAIVLIVIFIFLWRFKFKARFLPNISLGIIILGIASLCQPLIPYLYHYGLAILITGVLSYMLVSHFE
jgi:hypothetical protein